MDSPCIKQTLCKVFKIFQCGKYLVAYVLKIMVNCDVNISKRSLQRFAQIVSLASILKIRLLRGNLGKGLGRDAILRFFFTVFGLVVILKSMILIILIEGQERTIYEKKLK